MKYAACLALFTALCYGEPAKKPVCNATNRGQFWPEEANSSREAARRFYQGGELELCALGVWKYRWERMSVNARVVANKKGHPFVPVSKKQAL